MYLLVGRVWLHAILCVEIKWSEPSLPTTWVPEIELRLLDLVVGSALTL